jgi:hypothetical protein
VPDSLNLGLIMAVPAAVVRTLPVTVKPSTIRKSASTENSAENSETVSVKHQKGGAMVVSTENSQCRVDVEGGRGK